jgi:hypothetical protein
MPVHAEISFRKISVSASYRQVYATASLPVATVVVASREPATEVTFQNLFSEVGYRLLTPELTWQRLFVSDITLNPERTVYTFDDAFVFSDGVSLNPNLGPVSAVEFSDSISSFGFSLGKTDLVGFAENVVREFGRPTSDTFSFADSSTLAVSAGRSDSLTLSDSVSTLRTFQRAFTDSFPFADSLSLSLSDVADDTFSFAEQTSRSASRVSADSFGFSDSLSHGVEKIQSESIPLSESSLVVDVGTVNFVLTAGDWVISAPFSDFPTITESTVFSISQALSDAFTLDDFAQVDKGFSGVKTNVYSLDEALSFGFQKGIQESIISSDLLAKSLSYGGFAHSFAFADSATLSTGKVPVDTLSMAETLSLAQYSGSGVLNQGQVGLMLLNSD